MAETDYAGNSKKGKQRVLQPDEVQDRQKLKPVATSATIKQQTLGERFKNVFLNVDAKGTAGFVFRGVLVPAARDMVFDAGKEALFRILYPDAAATGRTAPGHKSGSGPGPKTNYQGMSSGRGAGSMPLSGGKRSEVREQTLPQYVYGNQAEPERILDTMKELIDRREYVTVADYRELSGYDSNYVDVSWGWVNLMGSQVVKLREGWTLDLPSPVRLN